MWYSQSAYISNDNIYNVFHFLKIMFHISYTENLAAETLIHLFFIHSSELLRCMTDRPYMDYMETSSLKQQI